MNNEERMYSEYDFYPRTFKPYSLNEILFICDRLVKGLAIDQVARMVERTPRSIIFKFIEYRPYDKNSNMMFNRSVRTEEETKNYQDDIIKIEIKADYDQDKLVKELEEEEDPTGGDRKL